MPRAGPGWPTRSPLPASELTVLNLFAYTGGATLAMAAAGARVVHVDSARGSRGLGSPQCRAVGPVGGADPLDCRRRREIRPPRARPRQPLRRGGSRPAQLWPRAQGGAVEVRRRPGSPWSAIVSGWPAIACDSCSFRATRAGFSSRAGARFARRGGQQATRGVSRSSRSSYHRAAAGGCLAASRPVGKADPDRPVAAIRNQARSTWNDITSPHNPRVKLAVKLRDARGRAEQGRIIIDGCREVNRALVAGVRIVEAFVCQELDQRHALHALVRLLAAHNVPLIRDQPRGARAAGVRQSGRRGDRRGRAAAAHAGRSGLAPAAAAWPCWKRWKSRATSGPCSAAPTRPASRPSIVADPATDLFNPNCIRASLGTVFSVPVCTATGQQTLDWLRAKRLDDLRRPARQRHRLSPGAAGPARGCGAGKRSGRAVAALAGRRTSSV